MKISIKYTKIEHIDLCQQGILAGQAIDFHFSVYKQGERYKKDIITEHYLRIIFSDWLLIRWKKENISDEIIKKMAYPFADDLITEKLTDGTLRVADEKIYGYSFSEIEGNESYPYDIDKIEISTEAIEKNIEEKDICTAITHNELADKIITARDNINTIYCELYEQDILLKLQEERSLLDLFREVDTIEKFSYRLSSLSGLIDRINTGSLKKIISCEKEDKDKKNEKDIGSISVLEYFLYNKNCDNNSIEFIIKTFRNIRKIRNMYPVHRDKLDGGVIDKLEILGIKFPISDYTHAWECILTNYSNALECLLEMLKSIHSNTKIKSF
jgi:hypothetical protein